MVKKSPAPELQPIDRKRIPGALVYRNAEHYLSGTMFKDLEPKAREGIAILTKSDSPSLLDLRRSMIELNKTHGNWANFLLAHRGFGREIVDSIGDYALDKGIEYKIIRPKKKADSPDEKRKLDSNVLAMQLSPRAILAIETMLGNNYPTLDDLRAYIEANPSWREDFRRLKACSNASIREIKEFARKNGIC